MVAVPSLATPAEEDAGVSNTSATQRPRQQRREVLSALI
jgi:hypothetical protein